ncbi:MAG: hypothetical protein P1U34_06875 [Coxiellaceae bacterium]|nr:hypothetical protein [Coxiellaceae bacterium]
MRKLITLCLLCAFTVATALPWDAKGVHTDIASQVSQPNQVSQQKVQSILHWFNTVDGDRSLFSKSSMYHYFSNNIKYSVNGTVASQGETALYQRFSAMLKNIKHYHVNFPLKAVVVNKNEAVFVYRINAKLVDGNSYTDLVAVTAHVNTHGKFDQWHAVIERIHSASAAV